MAVPPGTVAGPTGITPATSNYDEAEVVLPAAAPPVTQPPGTTGPPAPVTLTEVNAYFATAMNGPAWVALTPAEKDRALAAANAWLQTLCWDTSKICCGTDFQAAYVMAAAELALALHQNPTAVIGGPAQAGQTGTFTKRQKLGDLEIEFDQFNVAAAAAATADPRMARWPLVLQKFPWLVDLLGCWLKLPSSTGSGLLYRVRS